MKALSLWQPYATGIWLGFKRNETRSWKPSDKELKPGQWVAIHAARSTPAAKVNALMQQDGIRQCLEPMQITPMTRTGAMHSIPMGGVIAIAQVRDFVPITQAFFVSDVERAWGDYTPGRWCWRFSDVLTMARMVHCPGRQKLWTLPLNVTMLVVAQLIADKKIRPSDAAAQGLLGPYDPEGGTEETAVARTPGRRTV